MSIVSIDQAVKLLKAGTPVALPTETVYGLAAPIDQPQALKKVFEIKKRPLTDPLIVHVSSVEMAKTLFLNFDDNLQRLAEHFWPGPLTLVAKKNKSLVSDLITSGFDTVAVRIPASKIFKEVIEKTGAPLAAPSANLFKKVSPTSAHHILETLPGVNVIDGGRCEVGIESTIYDVSSRQILRPGDITHDQIENLLNNKITYTEKNYTPGSEAEHYRPSVPVLVFDNKKKIQFELNLQDGSVELQLDPNPKIAARNFYSDLRKYDKAEHTQILIYYDSNWTDTNWNALKNRLLKTASKWIQTDEK